MDQRGWRIRRRNLNKGMEGDRTREVEGRKTERKKERRAGTNAGFDIFTRKVPRDWEP